MDRYLNRAARNRRIRLLGLLITITVGERMSAGEPAVSKRSPQRIATADSQAPIALVKPSQCEPSLTIREPQDSLDWLTLFNLDQRDLTVAPVSLRKSMMVSLPGFSTASLRQSAAKSLDESAARLDHKASLSAAAAATQALRFVAQSIDASNGNGDASTNLGSALVAIHEAADFAGRYGMVDNDAIQRLVKSHETASLKSADLSKLSSLVAADVYLNSASQSLQMIAQSDPLAANAIGLLARSYRQRSDESPLALATSVHLMRAAAAASPQDRGIKVELADVLDQAKLHQEAESIRMVAATMSDNAGPSVVTTQSSSVIAVVSGSKKTDNDSGTRQAIRLEQITPDAFANISSSKAGPAGSSVPIKKAPVTPEAAEIKKEGNSVSRAFKSMTQRWR